MHHSHVIVTMGLYLSCTICFHSIAMYAVAMARGNRTQPSQPRYASPRLLQISSARTSISSATDTPISHSQIHRHNTQVHDMTIYYPEFDFGSPVPAIQHTSNHPSSSKPPSNPESSHIVNRTSSSTVQGTTPQAISKHSTGNLNPTSTTSALPKMTPKSKPDTGAAFSKSSAAIPPLLFFA